MAQKKHHAYIYFKSNLEIKNTVINTNLNGGEKDFLKLIKIEPTISYGINAKNYTFNIGFNINGYSKYSGTFSKTNVFAKETISTSSYGLELLYVFKLYQTRNRHPFTFGFGINFNYQYIFYNRKLDSYFTNQNDLHINENLNSSVLSSGLLLMLEQNISKKIAINFNAANRFYIPLTNIIYNYSNNHYLLSLGVKYNL